MKETLPEERAHYSRQFKHEVIKEYLRGEGSKADLHQKYGIRIHGGILRWMRQLGYEDKVEKEPYLSSLSLLSLKSKKKTDNPNVPSSKALEERIKELEHLLEDEQLRSEAYRRMIDIAEKEFHIPIQKKPDTK
jgi:transposase